MAKSKEISVSLGRTIGDGDFGNLKFNVHETVTLDEGDDAEREHRLLLKRVKRRAGKLQREIENSLEN